jgi:nucleoside-diphosphate-sugar epimerase
MSITPINMISLTGSSGFLGSALMSSMNQKGISCRRLLRREDPRYPDDPVVGDLDGKPISLDFSGNCEVLIHAAARAHRMDESGNERLVKYREVNVEGTRALVDAAQTAGVKRIVYLSSIKVCGESHLPGSPMNPRDVCHPIDPYGISKREAEDYLHVIANKSEIEMIILRLVIVHGPGAKGNLRSLLEAIAKGRTLPLGSVRNNRRSLLGVENACSAILRAATAPFPEPSGQIDTHSKARIYHLADEGVVSTRRLIEVLAEGMGMRPRLIPMAKWLAMAAAVPLGKGGAVKRLFGDLEVDTSDFYRDFDWKPEVSLEDGLRSMARAWKEHGGW